MPHIKDKNLFAAKAQVDDLKVADLKKMTIEEVAKLAIETDVIEKELKAHAKIVKDHVNQIYAPMCAKKKELEIKYAFLSAKLEKVKEVNPAVGAIAKLVGK
jgi:hypothetical protein